MAGMPKYGPGAISSQSFPRTPAEEKEYIDKLQEQYRQMQNSSAMQGMANQWSKHLGAELTSQINQINTSAYTPVKKPPADPLDDHASRVKMLGMRLRWAGDKIPYNTLHTHREGETIFVFLVVDGKPVTLEDNAGLFPSDTLVTQLRLIEK